MQYLVFILKKLFVIYLAFKFNVASCIFIYELKLTTLVKDLESKILEDPWCNRPIRVTLGKNSERGGSLHAHVIRDRVAWGGPCWGESSEGSMSTGFGFWRHSKEGGRHGLWLPLSVFWEVEHLYVQEEGLRKV